MQEIQIVLDLFAAFYSLFLTQYFVSLVSLASLGSRAKSFTATSRIEQPSTQICCFFYSK
jgi:hypothetical protein